MKHLTIRDFGPIKEVDITLRRLNLIIGPQSSGKSCVLKIASFCDWMERRIQQTQLPESYCTADTVTRHLINFHRLAGYMTSDSYFCYESDTMRFEFFAGKPDIHFQWKEAGRWDYRPPKIAYIPAERNLVAAIPNWLQVSMNFDNILDFMKEWEFARKAIAGDAPVLNLPVKYRYNRSSQSDRILLDNGEALDFAMTSSGLQSLIPLYIMADYLTDGYFKEPHSTVESDLHRENLTSILASARPSLSPVERLAMANAMLTPDHTDLFIEEPEAHIFPSTQKSFVYELVRMLNRKNRQHICFMTTHSPYIMTSVNNLIFAGETSMSQPDIAERISRIIPRDMQLRLADVGAFAMDDGRINPIIDTETGIISADALDMASAEIAEDFDRLLESSAL